MTSQDNGVNYCLLCISSVFLGGCAMLLLKDSLFARRVTKTQVVILILSILFVIIVYVCIYLINKIILSQNSSLDQSECASLFRSHIYLYSLQIR